MNEISAAAWAAAQSICNYCSTRFPTEFPPCDMLDKPWFAEKVQGAIDVAIVDSQNVGNCHVTLESETLRDKAAREMLCAMIGNPKIVASISLGPRGQYVLTDDDSRAFLCDIAYRLADTLAEAGKIPNVEHRDE